MRGVVIGNAKARIEVGYDGLELHKTRES
jgi:hypothetical protein